MSINKLEVPSQTNEFEKTCVFIPAIGEYDGTLKTDVNVFVKIVDVSAETETFAIPIEKEVIVPVGAAVETFIPIEFIFPALIPAVCSSEAKIKY
jgi:hypothetical protein